MKHILNISVVQDLIIDKQKKIFTPLDLQRYFDVSYETARKFIARQVKKGIYIKLRRGLYIDKNFIPSTFLIANRVYEPSYVSFEYALMFYGIIPDTVYSVTSATTKSTKEFMVNNVSYKYLVIKKNAFTSYEMKRGNGESYYIATPEKAFVDYLYFVDLGKKVLYDRIDVSKLNLKRIIECAEYLKRESLKQLVKKVYDQSRSDKKIIY
ncbi:MAG: hypothetical protein ABIF17_04840 [Patescibacteria group bacterium]